MATLMLQIAKRIIQVIAVAIAKISEFVIKYIAKTIGIYMKNTIQVHRLLFFISIMPC